MLTNAVSLFAPDQGGAIWIAVLVTFLVFGDFERLRSRRNLSLAGLLLVAPFLVNVMAWEGRRLAFVFTVIYLTTALYTVWGLLLAYRWPGIEWQIRLPKSALRALLVLMVAINAAVVFGRMPDDAGYYTNIGAARWVETGTLPYADSKLKGPEAPAFGAAATYGPVLYAAHIPFQWLLRTPRNARGADPRDPAYQLPPVLATKLTCFVFYLLGLFAVFKLVHRGSGLPFALGAAAVYAASPYLVGLGGEEWVVTGLRFISHIAPAALVLLALVAIEVPAVSGMLLALAAGALFYPAFLFPVWFGYYYWRKSGALRFAIGFAITGAVIAAVVIAFTQSPEGTHPLRLFLESTLEHQEGTGAREYGASGFGFWGTHPWLASFWQSPLFGSTSIFKPTFILYTLFALSAFFLARGRSVPQFAGLIAALCAGIQLYKTHAAGTYVEWYLPFLIVALFARGSSERAAETVISEPNGLHPAS